MEYEFEKCYEFAIFDIYGNTKSGIFDIIAKKHFAIFAIFDKTKSAIFDKSCIFATFKFKHHEENAYQLTRPFRSGYRLWPARL